MGHRNLILQCRDGSLSWNALFLAPLVSRSVWEAIASSTMGNSCSQSESVVHFQLPDYSTTTVRCFLELITSGVAVHGGSRKELEELLVNLCGDLNQFSDFARAAAGKGRVEALDGVVVLRDVEEDDEERADDVRIPINAVTSGGTMCNRKRTLRTPTKGSKRRKRHLGNFESFSCPMCPKNKLIPSFLIIHLCRTHFKEELRQKYPHHSLEEVSSRGELRKFVCPECGVWRSYQHLVEHLGAKHEKVLQFLSLDLREALMRVKASNTVQTLGCPICATPVSLHKNSLRMHLCEAHAWEGLRRVAESAVSSPSGYVCPCCGKSMPSINKLTRHYGVEHDKFMDYIPEKFWGKISKLCN